MVLEQVHELGEHLRVVLGVRVRDHVERDVLFGPAEQGGAAEAEGVARPQLDDDPGRERRQRLRDDGQMPQPDGVAVRSGGVAGGALVARVKNREIALQAAEHQAERLRVHRGLQVVLGWGQTIVPFAMAMPA